MADTTAALASPTAPTSELARSQAAEIKAAVDAILDEVKHNKTPARLEADGCEHREVYNAQVEAFEKNGQGWEQLPWLWAECYLCVPGDRPAQRTIIGDETLTLVSACWQVPTAPVDLCAPVRVEGVRPVRRL